jgi:Fe-S cluster assembly protein SufD
MKYSPAKVHGSILQGSRTNIMALPRSPILSVSRKQSNLATNTISLHGGFIRNNVFVRLNGEHCENHSMGLYFLIRGNILTTMYILIMPVPIASAISFTRGCWMILPRVLLTDAYWFAGMHRKQTLTSPITILLTDDAKDVFPPQLEIYADDVKCSHGSTMGQIDENAMFYLRSRGIDQREARLMLDGCICS